MSDFRDDAGSQERLANYLLESAKDLAARGATCAIDGVKLLAFEAARARAWVLCERLAGFDQLAEFEREEILAYARLVADGEGNGVMMRLGGPSVRGWMRERGWSPVQYDAAKRNYLRFLHHVGRDPRRPRALRATLPLLPALSAGWVRQLVERAKRWSLALALSCAAAVALSGDALHRGTASAIVALDLGDGTRLVESDIEGRWWISTPDGTVEWAAPASLALPRFFEGGASGDLTGDGSPELVLYVSEEFDTGPLDCAPGQAPPCHPLAGMKSAIDVFTRYGGGWRRLARVSGLVGTYDLGRCERTLNDLIAARRAGRGIPPALRVERRHCPSHIGQVTVSGGVIHVFASSYARDHLVVRCDASGCMAPQQAVSYESDATSAVWVDSAHLVVGTGCWRDPIDGGGPHAYGILSETWTGAAARLTGFLPLEGRTHVARLPDGGVLAFTGPPCPGDASEAIEVAAAGETPASPWRCALRKLDVGAEGSVAVRESTSLDSACEGARVGGEAALVIARRSEGPALVLLALVEGRGPPHSMILAFDLSHPLDAQHPDPIEAADGTSIVAADSDGDGQDEILARAPRAAPRRLAIVAKGDALALSDFDR